MDHLRDVIRRNRMGEAVALPSICSAHPDVLRAALLLAREKNQPLLVEATSNQVNQFGGYTGMRPADFVQFVHGICDSIEFDREAVIFGGDHLGPQAWRSDPAEEAMAKAEEMVQAYVRAGFSKIHLDCAEGCRGEPPQVGDEIAAGRTARLAMICEAAAPTPDRLSYVIGTEVPPPGGARTADAHMIRPTDPDAARATLEVHRRHFLEQGLASTWARVVGLVLQPGLEFGPGHVDHFPFDRPDALSPALTDAPDMAFEAHSTDYQRPEVYPELARRHFAVLKVGPALTFALRQALFALDHVREWLCPVAGDRRLPAVMERLMIERPGAWLAHYEGSGDRLRLLRAFGYADRIRYYWPEPEAQSAVRSLLARLAQVEIPRPLLQQYFPDEILDRADRLRTHGMTAPEALVAAQVQAQLAPYFF